MLLYDFILAPAPRRVRLFAAEKGLKIPTEQVDLRKGEQFVPEFTSKNPDCTVPVLQLDDQTYISGAMPICRYLNSLAEAPPLFGRDARESALIDMWQDRVENGHQMAITWYRNSFPGLKGRAVSGRHGFDQIPDLATRGQQQWNLFIEDMESWLSERPFVAGESFSIVDITAWISLEFAKSRVDYVIPDKSTSVLRWYEMISTRPSIGTL